MTSTSDARVMMLYTTDNANVLDAVSEIAADCNNDGTVNTVDVRGILACNV